MIKQIFFQSPFDGEVTGRAELSMTERRSGACEVTLKTYNSYVGAMAPVFTSRTMDAIQARSDFNHQLEKLVKLGYYISFHTKAWA